MLGEPNIETYYWDYKLRGKLRGLSPPSFLPVLIVVRVGLELARVYGYRRLSRGFR